MRRPSGGRPNDDAIKLVRIQLHFLQALLAAARAAAVVAVRDVAAVVAARDRLALDDRVVQRPVPPSWRARRGCDMPRLALSSLASWPVSVETAAKPYHMPSI